MNLAPPPLPEASKTLPLKPPKSWWGLVIDGALDALEWTVEVTHDGTDWILGKATVNIEQQGKVRDTENGAFADYRITVTRSDKSFTSQIKDIPCDKYGVPSEEAQHKFKEAVDRIKEILSKLQD